MISNAPLPQHVTHAFVVLFMLAGDRVFAQEVVLADLVIGDLGRQILCGNGQGGQKVIDRPLPPLPISTIFVTPRKWSSTA